jgi:hypothetical protein
MMPSPIHSRHPQCPFFSKIHHRRRNGQGTKQDMDNGGGNAGASMMTDSVSFQDLAGLRQDTNNVCCEGTVVTWQKLTFLLGMEAVSASLPSGL